MKPHSKVELPVRRAPLLWIYVPWCCGYLVGISGVVSGYLVVSWILVFMGILLSYGLTCHRCRLRGGLWLWKCVFLFTAILTGAQWWDLATAPDHAALHWEHSPPREMVLKLRIERIYRMNHESSSGYWDVSGKVIDAGFPFPNKPLPARLKCQLYDGHMLGPLVEGQLVDVRGVVYPPRYRLDGNFSLLSGKVLSVNRAGEVLHIDQFRRAVLKRILSALEKGAPEGTLYAGYLQAMLTGDKSLLGKSEKGLLRDAGVMHFFAVSGFHLSVVAYICFSVFQMIGLSRQNASAWMLVFCALYVWLTGASVSAQRALLMLVAYFGSGWVMRRPDALAATVTAGWILVLVDPPQLFSPGYQLSFVVVIGIITQALPLHMWLHQSKSDAFERNDVLLNLPRKMWASLRGYLIGSFAISWTAFWMSAPIIACHFGKINFMSIVLNTLLVGLFGLTMTAGFLSALCGMVGLLPVSGFINHASWLLLSIIEKVIAGAMSFPLPWNDTAHVYVAAPAVVGMLLIGCLKDLRKNQNRRWLLAIPVFSFISLILSRMLSVT